MTPLLVDDVHEVQARHALREDVRDLVDGSYSFLTFIWTERDRRVGECLPKCSAKLVEECLRCRASKHRLLSRGSGSSGERRRVGKG